MKNCDRLIESIPNSHCTRAPKQAVGERQHEELLASQMAFGFYLSALGQVDIAAMWPKQLIWLATWPLLWSLKRLFSHAAQTNFWHLVAIATKWLKSRYRDQVANQVAKKVAKTFWPLGHYSDHYSRQVAN